MFIGRDPVTGKPVQINRTYSADRKEPGAGRRAAEKKLAALVAAVERGEYGGTKATFGSLLDEWTAHSERMGRSPKTLYEYRRKIDKSIRPDLGAMRLDKLTAHDLDKLYARQLAAGLSPSTVLMHHRIVSAALKQGRKWGWVDRNVADDATPPSARKPEITVPSPEQVRALIAEARVAAGAVAILLVAGAIAGGGAVALILAGLVGLHRHAELPGHLLGHLLAALLQRVHGALLRGSGSLVLAFLQGLARLAHRLVGLAERLRDLAGEIAILLHQFAQRAAQRVLHALVGVALG